MDRFSKTCLFLITMFLALIALRPVIAPQSVRASQPRQYSYVTLPKYTIGNMEQVLTEASKKGFEVVGVTAYDDNNQVLFVLAK